MLDLPSAHTSLKVASRRVDDGVWLVAAGEIDLATVDILTAELAAAGRQGDLTVDLSGVSFLGAIGVRALLRSARDQRDHQRAFRVVGLRPHLVRLFEGLGIMTELTTPSP